MQKYEFARPLGDVVKQARHKMGITQNQLADLVSVDVRTILNIENYRGNHKMDVVFSIIRVLKIDPRDIFYPELKPQTSAEARQLQLMISECNETEAQALIPVCHAVLSALRAKDALTISKD